MSDYRNYYNFKNSIRHFINIDNLEFPDSIGDYSKKEIDWTSPFKFYIRKNENSYRTLKIPNMLSFVASLEKFKVYDNFNDIKLSDFNHKRMDVNIELGEFKIDSYRKCLENDFLSLCIYENLLRLDIKEFYGRIYTHNLKTINNENFITSMNDGCTNGLIMGNYISLYFAEQQLSEISKAIENELEKRKIDCEFSYFSDDFYFFVNKRDKDKVISIFDEVLDRYNLERNEDKVEIWTYESYNKRNLVERYWKKVISSTNINKAFLKKTSLVFINQLVYRSDQINEYKLKKIFINGFFKTHFFQKDINFNQFYLKEHDYHQLGYLFSVSPESMIYAVDKLIEIQGFNEKNLNKFFEVRFKESLLTRFQDEQLYFFYSMYKFRYYDLLKYCRNEVIKSENQVLISYYLMLNWFDEDNINFLKSNSEESRWFANYHLILNYPDLFKDLDDSIRMYLMPKSIYNKRANMIKYKNYFNFYKKIS